MFHATNRKDRPDAGERRDAPAMNRLLVTTSLWNEITQTCVRDGLEHGGKALGRRFHDGVAVACIHIGPGPEAERGAVHFRPDIAFQQETYNTLVRRHPRLRLTLDYHLHPGGPPALSTVDLETARAILSPNGWGLESLLFMVLSPGPDALMASVFDVSAGEDETLRIREVALEVVSDHHPRVTQLLDVPPERMTAVVAEEVLQALAERTTPGEPQAHTWNGDLDHGETRAGVLLHGYHRLEERLVQVLDLEAMLDTYPVGRAYLWDSRGAGGVADVPPPVDLELKLVVDENGRITRGTFGWHGTPVPCDIITYPVRGELHARNEGLAPGDALAHRHVLLVGVGSVGAPMAVNLAATGVGRFTLVDPDRFTPPNVARHTGDLRDVGRRKVDVVREQILARNPAAEVTCLPEDIRAAETRARIGELCREADLVIVTTDDPGANLVANRFVVEADRPGIFVGVFDGGIGGEIFVRMPGSPGCYNCVAGFRANLPPLPRDERAHDYLNLPPGDDIPPMNALGIDITHTVAVASSVALGLLGVDDRLEDIEVSDTETRLLFVGNGRKGWIFSRPFEIIPAKLGTAGCPICSPDSHATPLLWGLEDPTDAPDAHDGDAHGTTVIGEEVREDETIRAVEELEDFEVLAADDLEDATVYAWLDADDMVFEDLDREDVTQTEESGQEALTHTESGSPSPPLRRVSQTGSELLPAAQLTPCFFGRQESLPHVKAAQLRPPPRGRAPVPTEDEEDEEDRNEPSITERVSIVDPEPPRG